MALYKVVVYWRWDGGGRQSADCFWCVPWPDITDAEFEQELEVARSTHVLTHGSDAEFNFTDPSLLVQMGFPEAAKMLFELAHARLRSRFNQLDMEVFDSDVPVTREQIEAIKLDRRYT